MFSLHPLHPTKSIQRETELTGRYFVHLPLHSMPCREFAHSFIFCWLRLNNWSPKFGVRSASSSSQHNGQEHFVLNVALLLTELQHSEDNSGAFWDNLSISAAVLPSPAPPPRKSLTSAGSYPYIKKKSIYWIQLPFYSIISLFFYQR